MKLRGPPTPQTLVRLYWELGKIGAPAVGEPARWVYGKPRAEELLVLASQAARYDPRLLWILVQLIAEKRAAFDPQRVRAALRESAWPASLGVAFEFARRALPSPDLDDFADFVMLRVPPASGEQFFLSTHAFGGLLARREAEETLAEYKRWGYFGREEPFRKEMTVTARGTLDRPERMNLLRRLAERHGSLTLRDYLEALDGRASSRQASRDLALAPFLTRRGATRGARYHLKLRRQDGDRLVVGQKVRLALAGRVLHGTVVADLGRLKLQEHQMVRVALRDPSMQGARFELEIPAGWTSGVPELTARS
jgi:hypothetical protein